MFWIIVMLLQGGEAGADNNNVNLLPGVEQLPQPFQAVAADLAADFEEADDDWEDLDDADVEEEEDGEEDAANPQRDQRNAGVQANQGNAGCEIVTQNHSWK